jgi:cell division protein FtsQ
VDGPLPLVRAKGGIEGTRLGDAAALGAARIAGAAPAPLRRRTLEVGRDGDRGFVVRMRKGPELVFGAAARLRAKWVAAARVLADSDARGASYVDVRVPERPAVGGLGYQVTAPKLPEAPLSALIEQGEVAGATAASETPEATDPTQSATPTVEAPATATPAPETTATPTAEADEGGAVAPMP